MNAVVIRSIDLGKFNQTTTLEYIFLHSGMDLSSGIRSLRQAIPFSPPTQYVTRQKR